MKKISIFLAFIILSSNCFSQKDSTQKDTVITLSYTQIVEIYSTIQIQASGKADVRPEVWKEVLNILNNSVKILPKKEQPKK